MGYINALPLMKLLVFMLKIDLNLNEDPLSYFSVYATNLIWILDQFSFIMIITGSCTRRFMLHMYLHIIFQSSVDH